MERGAYFCATSFYVKTALWSAFRGKASIRPSLKCHGNVKLFQLLTILILAGDVAVNPGPITMGHVNCRSWRNKGPLVSDWIEENHCDIVGRTETHLKATDTAQF